MTDQEMIENRLKFIDVRLLTLKAREDSAEKEGFDIEVMSIQGEEFIYIEERDFLRRLEINMSEDLVNKLKEILKEVPSSSPREIAWTLGERYKIFVAEVKINRILEVIND